MTNQATPISADQQKSILSNIRDLVPDSARHRSERRHQIMLGVILGLQAVDHGCVPPHWLMNVMAGATDRLFRKEQE